MTQPSPPGFLFIQGIGRMKPVSLSIWRRSTRELSFVTISAVKRVASSFSAPSLRFGFPIQVIESYIINGLFASRVNGPVQSPALTGPLQDRV